MTTPDGIRAVLQPIMRLAFSIEKIADRTLRERLGLTFSRFRMLTVLERRPGANQRDIAAFWGVAEASVSRQVEELRRRKLVVRTHNPANRRSHALALTAAGRALLGRARNVMDRELEATFRAFGRADRAVLVKQLQAMVGILDSSCALPGCGGRGAPRKPAKLRTR